MIEMKTKQYRQGDVWIERIEAIPGNARKQTRDSLIILAHGEATGHHHSISEEWVDVYGDERAGVTYLEVREAIASLKHQEHDTIELPPGKYVVWRQMEYSTQKFGRVQD